MALIDALVEHLASSEASEPVVSCAELIRRMPAAHVKTLLAKMQEYVTWEKARDRRAEALARRA